MADEGIRMQKRIAMGDASAGTDGGDFGVTKLNELARGSTAPVGRPRKSHLRDEERSPPIPRGPGYVAAQAMPDHGSVD